MMLPNNMTEFEKLLNEALLQLQQYFYRLDLIVQKEYLTKIIPEVSDVLNRYSMIKEYEEGYEFLNTKNYFHLPLRLAVYNALKTEQKDISLQFINRAFTGNSLQVNRSNNFYTLIFTINQSLGLVQSVLRYVLGSLGPNVIIQEIRNNNNVQMAAIIPSISKTRILSNLLRAIHNDLQVLAKEQYYLSGSSKLEHLLNLLKFAARMPFKIRPKITSQPEIYIVMQDKDIFAYGIVVTTLTHITYKNSNAKYMLNAYYQLVNSYLDKQLRMVLEARALFANNAIYRNIFNTRLKNIQQNIINTVRKYYSNKYIKNELATGIKTGKSFALDIMQYIYFLVHTQLSPLVKNLNEMYVNTIP